MKNNPNLNVLLENLIDYAGLFPPANLPLDAAIENYANYINSEDAWMLGPFIIPVKKINELQAYADLFLKKKPLNLSVVGRKSESENECVVQLKEDLEQIHAYSNKYNVWSNVEAFEMPLPSIVPTQDLLEEVSSGAKKLGMKAFCEMSLVNDDHWKKNLCSTLDAIVAFNSLHKDRLGVKLRTGGIKAEMFPSPEKVAFVIASCRDRDLPIKFTAGLHHPIRMYREEVNTKMHGFLNIFLAGMLAYHLNLDEERIEKIISDENTSHFTIADDRLVWKSLSITSQEMKELRKNSLCSFGSCSFDEPRDELLELSNRQEASK
ncbi:hypothetical protein [Peribacillus phoenicis]|uniref:hypothetical protein n=1 Tax=unclassified Peribacillus TaxID=2675266 RepID=UPI0039A327F1